MFITPLGHTECLIEIPNNKNELVRILIDSWFSDVCVGDLMARRERVRFDYDTLPRIDYIFISHSHLDHLDPYFLTEFFRYQSPTLLIPETCQFALDILKRYLPEAKIAIIRNNEKILKDGVMIEWVIWSSNDVGNEEDVMTLFVSNSESMIYHEIDTKTPFNESERQLLEEKITPHRWKSLLLIESGNEIEIQLRSLETIKMSERWDIVKNAEEIWSEKISEEWQYLHDYELYDPRYESWVTRAWIGQGITIPREIDEGLSNFHPLPLSRVASVESQTLKGQKLPKSSFALLPGKRYELMKNSWLKEIPTIKSIKVELYRTKSEHKHLSFLERLPWPAFASEREESIDDDVLLDLLNHRFLPFALASASDPLKAAILSSNDHRYRIAFKARNSDIIATYGFSWATGKYAREEKPIELSRISEIYFLDDITDFLEGKQELYSVFVHEMQRGKSYRLWNILGANFINTDLLTRKYTYHFERAKQWWDNKRLCDELLEIYQRKIKIVRK